MRKGVILDRDGTIVDVVRDAETGTISAAFHPSHLRLLPGVIGGLRALAGAGYALGIATNQPGAAKGQLPREAIERTLDVLGFAPPRRNDLLLDPEAYARFVSAVGKFR